MEKFELNTNIPILKIGKKTKYGKIYSFEVLKDALDSYFSNHDSIPLVNNIFETDPTIPIAGSEVAVIKKEHIKISKKSKDMKIKKIIFNSLDKKNAFERIVMSGLFGITIIATGESSNTGNVKTLNMHLLYLHGI